jgi:chemotaxis signal transduction protein
MEDVSPRPLSPAEYATHLESMSNEDFWKHAQALAAHSARPMQENVFNVSTSFSPSTTLCVTCFIRNGGSCVFPFNVIRTILPTSQHITRLPDVPPWVTGILSWRGETMAAIDLCSYVTQRELPPLQERITLVARHEDIWLAFCVVGIDETPVEVGLEQVVPFTPPPLPELENAPPPRGIVGALEQKDTTVSSPPVVLDIPGIFKDVMQRIESRDTHV